VHILIVMRMEKIGMPKRLRLIAILAGFALFTGCSSAPVSSGSVATEATAVSRWENKLVRRPGSEPEDAKVYLVKGGKRHWIVSASWISSHGYNWPGDVNEIPREELEAIPQGDAIQ
jgi:hypothetical protein